MVIYEVNLTVAPDEINAYSAWLEEHVREILDLDGFESAALYARSGTNALPGSGDGASSGGNAAADVGSPEDPDAPERVPSGERHWTVHYHLKSREALDRYLDEHADAMRAKGTDRFGEDQVSTERRILESRKVFSHQER